MKPALHITNGSPPRTPVTEAPSTDHRERLGLDQVPDLDRGSSAVSAHTLAHLPPGEENASIADLVAGLYAHSLSVRVQVFDALVERYGLHEYRDEVLTGPLATLSVQKTTELPCMYLAAADQLRAIVSRLEAGQDPDHAGLRVVDYEEEKVVRFIHSWKEPAFDVAVVRSMSDNDRAWCFAQVVYRMQKYQPDPRALHAAVALDIPNLNTILQQLEAQQSWAGSLRAEPSPYLLEVRQLLQARGVAPLARPEGTTTP